MFTSPKYKVLYDTAELVSIQKHLNGMWSVCILLDGNQFETILYYGYTKEQIIKITKEKYNIKEVIA